VSEPQFPVESNGPAVHTDGGTAFSFDRYSLTASSLYLLRDLTLRVKPGESVALLGPTGSGKSLLLYLLVQGHSVGDRTGRDWRQTGSLSVLGVSCSPQPPSQKDLRFVHERVCLVRGHSIWLPMSISENFRAVQVLAGVEHPLSYAAIIEEWVAESRTRSSLLSLAEVFPKSVDAPYLQFLALLRAMVRRPDILLLDEALASMDPILLQHSERMLTERSAAQTVVWATNDLYQASRVSERTLLLTGGTLVEDSETAKFFTSPKTPEAEMFISGRES
jgi:phosphate transport system ATP-binding protein